MKHVFLDRLWRGGRYAALVLALCLFGSAAWPRHSGVSASVPEILLYVNDTVVSPGDSTYYLSVYLTNVLQEVAGVEITLSAGVSGLIKLQDSIRIETTIVCVDPFDCNPADTTVDTLHIAPLLLEGSELATWDFVQARALSPYTFRVAAVADFPGGSSPAPLATGGPHLLFNIAMVREAALEVLDTLHDRRVPWQIARTATSFSDPTGKSIGLQDSLVCFNPPLCDSLYRVSYYDSTINILLDGAVTFGPNCLRGDANGSGTVSATDIIVIINYVFKSGVQPGCHGQSADVNCNGTVGASDIVYLVNYVYKSGPAPCGL